ncbi:MAG: stringent starvation protein B [Glomeribacter sp. 1016415]|uniref:ClpXP protease specificity-enhancing factor n=1 Tax=Mycoavidus cysteinexigens TaxID=1553431 RepID=A0A2Z6ESX4_9BURK|nr:ClpXP protease specificity-enhancing factor [Mycoavidus cysteinexigens]MCX8565795.1 stringent starvation protein B [Glomeribacter sp. 1016415]BBE08470.1 ClpXP protease specificity-enhancing factor [Mycoavidus cysteinexigens]GAM52815.1 ClpXP protease specificity-enhancing factor / Stringent starvation protein B [bacterium endosymbiont of Mortierella elongata FMR23-6]GLR00976.1 stringent starvation protein B [Mycoavidus cysteinexigens]
MQQAISTKPYLLRALYEWCTDNSYTPHVVVSVDNHVQVPREFVRDGKIVLNISFSATEGLLMRNDWIEFNARFSGRAHKIEIPVDNVLAIYALENGQGMAFPLEASSAEQTAGAPSTGSADLSVVSNELPPGASLVQEKPRESSGKKKSGRPHLKLVK